MNSETERIDFECEVQDLLAGQAGGQRAAGLLWQVVRDNGARQTLSEMLEAQQQARRSLGLDIGEEHMQASLAGVIEALRQGPGSGGPAAGRRREGGRRLLRAFFWPVGIAAALALAGLLHLTWSARSEIRVLHERMSTMTAAVKAPELKADDLTALRAVWRQVADETGQTRPWVMLSNGTGEFGYVPADRVGSNGGGMVLLHCVIVTDDRRTTQINLLVPARASVQLAVPESGRLAGRPIEMAVRASGGHADVNLTIGEAGGSQVGLRGRAQTDGRPTELGQFRLEGVKATVFLQAQELGHDVG